MSQPRVAASSPDQQRRRTSATVLTCTTTVSAATLQTHTTVPASNLPPSSHASTSPLSTHPSLSSTSIIPPSYSPFSPSSFSSSPPPVSPHSHASFPPPPSIPPPASSARLTDLCPSDKAKVGKLLLRVATLQAETQRHSLTDQHLRAIQEEHLRLQQQKAEVERRFDESMRLLKGYQDRLRQMEELRGQRRERRRARKDAEQMTDSGLQQPPLQGETPQEDERGEEVGGGEEKEQVVDSAHLHHLLHQQKLRIQQRMEELQRHADSSHNPTPAPHPRHGSPHSSPSHRHRSPAPSHWGVEGQATASPSLPSSASRATASSKMSSSSHTSESSSHGLRVPNRNPPVTVSVRYVKRGTTPSTSTAFTVPPPDLLPAAKPTSTSVSISSRPSAHTHPRLLSHSSSPPQRRSAPRVTSRERKEEGPEEEEEEEEDEENLLSQSSSPVSRRIHRLLNIQKGTALLKTRTPPPPPRPLPHTQPGPAAVKRPTPLHFPSSFSLSSSATRDSTLLDAEMQAVVEALNTAQSPSPFPPLSGRLLQYDGQLLDTLLTFDV